MKIALAILLALFIGLSGWLAWLVDDQADYIRQQMQILKGQHEALQLSNAGWESLKTKPVYVMKHRPTGDLYVQVPYRAHPYHFPGVCGREYGL